MGFGFWMLLSLLVYDYNFKKRHTLSLLLIWDVARTHTHIYSLISMVFTLWHSVPNNYYCLCKSNSQKREINVWKAIEYRIIKTQNLGTHRVRDAKSLRIEPHRHQHIN